MITTIPCPVEAFLTADAEGLNETEAPAVAPCAEIEVSATENVTLAASARGMARCLTTAGEVENAAAADLLNAPPVVALTENVMLAGTNAVL